MSFNSIKRRITALNNYKGVNYSRIIEKVRKGAYYDELTDTEKDAYKAYKESLGAGADDIARAELEIIINETPASEAYHFIITPRKKAPTPEELRERAQEIEDYFLLDAQEGGK